MSHNQLNTNPVTSIILLSFFLLLTCGNNIYCQKFNIEIQSTAKLDLNNTTDLYRDINNNICSVVYINTYEKGLKFYSNLSIEKILELADGYKLWIPSDTKVIKVSKKGFPLFEYYLPVSTYDQSVYILFLSTTNSKEVITIDTSDTYLTINSNPSDAKVYLNDNYFGKTPVAIKEINGMFNYRIEKATYGPVIGVDTVSDDKALKSIFVELFDYNRIINYNVRLKMLSSDFTGPSLLYGISVGQMKNPGWYVAAYYRDYNKYMFVPDDYYSEILVFVDGITSGVEIGMNWTKEFVFFEIGAGTVRDMGLYDNGENIALKIREVFIEAGIGVLLFRRVITGVDAGFRMGSEHLTGSFFAGWCFFPSKSKPVKEKYRK